MGEAILEEVRIFRRKTHALLDESYEKIVEATGCFELLVQSSGSLASLP
jgi:hypothetical protein